MATGQNGQIELSLPIINDIKNPFPSIDEQQIIVKEIETVEDQIIELEDMLESISC
jgi:restriction endonuclease S subunit